MRNGQAERGGPKRWATGLPAVATSMRRTVPVVGAGRTVAGLRLMNQPGGFDCAGCAWPEPATGEHKRVEWCESGAKAFAEEATRTRADRAFFADHAVSELRGWDDHALGRAGRLVEPMVKRRGDTYFRPIPWTSAMREIAAALRSLPDPDEAVFYTSGRTSNEAAFAYQLLARSYGTNNLPDCSNMCHEPTSTALGDTIGIGKGSVTLADFPRADVIIIAGQNPGTNHPRMLGTLEAAKRAGAHIIAINPLPEAGLLNFHNPQTLRGLFGGGTPLADLHLPIRNGGDQALFQLWNKWLVETDDAQGGAVIDHDFVDRHTAGHDALAKHLRAADADVLLAATGLGSDETRRAFERVAGAQRLIVCWAMGITQHRNAVETIKEIVNLCLLGGHIGRPGAGLCPVRGHSNVQGDRTMGIFERPHTALLDAIDREFTITSPRAAGLDAVSAVSAFEAGTARVFVGLGGNFVRAVPDSGRAEAAMARAEVTVHVSTKLNRSHLVPDGTSIILPALARSDVDRNLDGDAQFVTVEDSMGLVHASTGTLEPPSPHVRSEVAIVCHLALALFGDEHPVPWAAFLIRYDALRDRIARVIPGFDDFNERVRADTGFALPHPPRDERRFDTDDGRAHLSVTEVAVERLGEGELLLQTLRSHDQYNTTIYGFHDRYRGLSGDRRIVMVNPIDVERLGFHHGERVDVVTALAGPERRAHDYRVVSYPTPVGTAAAYFPEANVLIPLDHHDPVARTPASKAIPVRLERATRTNG